MLAAEILIFAVLVLTFTAGFLAGVGYSRARHRVRWSFEEGARRIQERRLMLSDEPWQVITSGSLRVGPNRRIQPPEAA